MRREANAFRSVISLGGVSFYLNLSLCLGIPRTPGCEYLRYEYSDDTDWALYKCPLVDYEMLAIENMDEDTELRRLSPVAVRQTVYGDSYLDLINGPPDHGWCSGYSCKRRLSVFFALVIPGKTLFTCFI